MHIDTCTTILEYVQQEVERLIVADSEPGQGGEDEEDCAW